MKHFYPFMVFASALPVLFGVHLYKLGHRERQPRPAPVVEPVAAEPTVWSELEGRVVPLNRWRAPVGPQHSEPVRTVTF